MSKLKMIFSGHVDRKTVENLLSDSQPFLIDVVNNYTNDAAQDLTINAADLDAGNLEALLLTIDNATFPFEENAFIWKIKYAAHDFNLEYSFVRDNVSTDGLLTAIPAGSPIMVTFEIPGFITSQSRTISAWYNSAFDPDDLAALAEIGISLVGNGTKFLVVNAVQCKVSFSKPEAVTDAYVIVNDFVDQIIDPT